MALQIYRQAGYHDLVLCSEHAEALVERPEHNGSWTAAETVGDEAGCDACIRKGLDYAHFSAKVRQRNPVKKAA